eukprot:TRINITY_DN3166_c0_g1_i4.p1 TRINITY_DN3166_c0_g1~~TRINITY_DN3166_c0_g1_i4.p1  ORF type:complete len:106 (+),score=29.89 TRINITY_DN3166_c0_g1_i4:113-430(+)
MKTGKLTRIGDVATGTGVFAMQQDQDGKLWIMGESPRVQILKITVDGATGKLQTKPIDLGEPIAELSKYLEAHGEFSFVLVLLFFLTKINSFQLRNMFLLCSTCS